MGGKTGILQLKAKSQSCSPFGWAQVDIAREKHLQKAASQIGGSPQIEVLAHSFLQVFLEDVTLLQATAAKPQVVWYLHHDLG